MAAFFLSLREGLEAALIVSILLGTLRRLGRSDLRRFIWLGVALALLVSLGVAAGLVAAGVEFEGQAEEVFEGVMLLLAAAFLTGMIFWMQRQGAQFRVGLETDVRKAVEDRTPKSGGWGLFAVAFLAVVREGIELALLLVATSLAGGALGVVAGAVSGIGVSVLLGVLIYRGVLHLNLRVFFRITNLLLLLFAAGMVALGLHELVEANLLPAIVDPIYNINPLLSDQSLFGALFKSLFGYNGNPALIETLAYLGYLGVVGWLIFGRSRRPIATRAA
jgi:high-affinity iron transporter